jgi:hypothetical protein
LTGIPNLQPHSLPKDFACQYATTATKSQSLNHLGAGPFGLISFDFPNGRVASRVTISDRGAPLLSFDRTNRTEQGAARDTGYHDPAWEPL